MSLLHAEKFLVRLFRRTNSIRRTLEAQHAVEAEAIDLRTGEASETATEQVHPDVQAAHGNLDLIELKLAQIRERQAAMLDTKKTPSRKGSVVQLDLRSMISLIDEDDENVDQFAATNREDRARRLMEG